MSKKKSSFSKNRSASQNCSLPFDFTNQVELLLPYKSYVKQECKERFLNQSKVRIHERYKTCNKELKVKLKKSEEAVDDVRTVTEYDDEFFKIVNGRPLFHSIPRFKSYTKLFDKLFRTLQEIAYKKDSALNIEMNFRIENNIYDKTLLKVSEQAKIFDKFIMEDYKKSMRILDEEEKLNNRLEAKMAQLHSLADESFFIMSRLLGLEYKYGLQQKYGRFLYYLSPSMWRASNREFARSVEIEAKGFDFGDTHHEDTFTALFEKMRNECCINPIKPVLYFSRPSDLLNVFEGIQEHLLYHFSREAQLVPHIKYLKDATRMLKQKNHYDSAVVTATIQKFKNRLSSCEERCAQLKKQFLKILYGFFYESVGTVEVLKFQFHLEFCFSKVFQEKPMNMDIITIARAIESMYFDYCKRLDSIKSGTVRRAMSKCMELNNQKMEQSKKAAKELRLFNRLERELLRAHNLLSEDNQLVSVETKYHPKKSINGDASKCNVNKRSYQSLNDAEIEYLTLFTDWTNDEDPALYLQSINCDKDNNRDS